MGRFSAIILRNIGNSADRMLISFIRAASRTLASRSASADQSFVNSALRDSDFDEGCVAGEGSTARATGGADKAPIRRAVIPRSAATKDLGRRAGSSSFRAASCMQCRDILLL